MDALKILLLIYALGGHMKWYKTVCSSELHARNQECLVCKFVSTRMIAKTDHIKISYGKHDFDNTLLQNRFIC